MAGWGISVVVVGSSRWGVIATLRRNLSQIKRPDAARLSLNESHDIDLSSTESAYGDELDFG